MGQSEQSVESNNYVTVDYEIIYCNLQYVILIVILQHDFEDD